MTYKPFTLLEIVICVAILSLAAVGIGWQMKGMLEIHKFEKSVGIFFTDLRKAQLVALSDRVDIDLTLAKTDKGYEYKFKSDDPLLCFISKGKVLTGIQEIRNEKKRIESLHLHLYPTGRIGPEEKITFLQAQERGVILDLSTPLYVELKRK
jgi:hypothetical protein